MPLLCDYVWVEGREGNGEGITGERKREKWRRGVGMNEWETTSPKAKETKRKSNCSKKTQVCLLFVDDHQHHEKHHDHQEGRKNRRFRRKIEKSIRRRRRCDGEWKERKTGGGRGEAKREEASNVCIMMTTTTMMFVYLGAALKSHTRIGSQVEHYPFIHERLHETLWGDIFPVAEKERTSQLSLMHSYLIDDALSLFLFEVNSYLL